MKKFVLFIGLIGLLCNVYSQSYQSVYPHEKLIIRQEVIKPELDPLGSGTSNLIPEKSRNDVIVGTSILDVQTYGGIQQRINVFDDGTIGATWMMSNNVETWDDRGTGYNYFNGTDWGEQPNERLESKRTGFPNYTDLGTNGEVNVSHALDDNDEFGILVARRLTKGEGEWEEFFVPGPEEGVQIVWPKVMTGGSDNLTIHLLAVSYGEEYNGQGKALLYYRSLDGGETWDITHQLFDGLGPDIFAAIEAEHYVWSEPHGNTIAFGVGFGSRDAFLLKSFDNGEEWEQSLVFETPWGGEIPDDTDAFGAGDGTFSLAMDADGIVHVVWGRMRYIYTAATEYFYPYTEGIIYWNETMDILDTTIISSYTLDYLSENGNLIGWIMPFNGSYELLGYGVTQKSLTTYPEIAIDNLGHIFVVYSAVSVEFTNGVENFRHIWATSSRDNGLTWSENTDINSGVMYWFSECMFPDVNLTSYDDGYIHVLFQTDDLPGWHYWLGNTDPTTNSFVYAPILKDMLLGVEDNNSIQSNLEAVECFPNPTTGFTKIQFSLLENNNVNFYLNNMLGQIIDKRELGSFPAGTHYINIDASEFDPGIYFYSIECSGEQITKKIIIY